MYQKKFFLLFLAAATLSCARMVGMNMWEAAKAGNLKRVQQGVAVSKATVRIQDDRGSTLLHIAAYHGRLEVVQYLVANGAQLNKQADNHWTPLHGAACYGHFEVVRYLVSNGAQKEVQDDDGLTPLHLAALRGRLEIVKYLIAEGAQVNKQCKYGTTPLHKAAQHGHFEVVKHLVEKGAQIDIQDNVGSTPLLLAAENDCVEEVKYLCGLFNFTALNYGCNNWRVAQKLLAFLNIKDVLGKTTLDSVRSSNAAFTSHFLTQIKKKAEAVKSPFLIAVKEKHNVDTTFI